MQKAVSALISAKVAARGFAANDPKFALTLTSVSSGIAGSAAAAAVVTAAGVTAPAWITAAAVAGLSVLFTAGISLAVDGIAKWFMNPDGTIAVQTSSSTTNVDFSVPIRPIDPYQAGQCQPTTIYNWCDPEGPSFPGCLPTGAINPTKVCDPGYSGTKVNSFEEAMTMSGYTYATKTSSGTTQTKTASDAVAALTDEQKAKPLNPEVLAAIADQAWKNAASQPGYQGVPYDASNPISAADATTYQAANTAGYPTVGDAVAPQPAPAGGTAATPFELPITSTGTGTVSTGDNTGSQTEKPTIDWTIGASGEAIPSMAVPVNFTPTLFAAPTGCPAPVSFVMFGKSYSISYGPFCDLMMTLAPIFLALGAAAAAMIFAEGLKS
jgi:hypothetical protein